MSSRFPIQQRGGGFTLAELLIALGILGVIATFTIPKVLQNQQNEQRASVVKETVSALYEITQAGVSDGTLKTATAAAVSGPYYLGKLNAVKLCPSNSLSEGCWFAAQGDIAFDDDEAGVLMHNGAAVVGFTTSGNVGRESVTIDWNGVSAPNQTGVDQIRMDVCHPYEPGPGCYIDAGFLRTNYPAYQIGPFTGSETLWDQIF